MAYLQLAPGAGEAVAGLPSPMASAGRVARNAAMRVYSRRGGILPAYATRTGDVELPDPIRYDPMGYAYALNGLEDELAELEPDLTALQPEARRDSNWKTFVFAALGAAGVYCVVSQVQQS